MQFLTTDKSRLLQLGRDLLVANQLRPYPRFRDWEPVIYRALQEYRELARPRAITQIGLRYINVIEIPAREVNMPEFFSVYPKLPVDLTDAYGPFMVRVELATQPPGHVLMLTFGSTASEGPGQSKFMLDLYDMVKGTAPVSFESVPEHVKAAHENVSAAFMSIRQRSSISSSDTPPTFRWCGHFLNN
ncbi:MAG: TIGR04255 family protein [Planctomycetes bacterium]|nr:TIGR04255 family protein [Planctomycetota bacterium]